MFEFRNLRKVSHQWSGATTAFFVYTHMSHDLCTGLLEALLPLVRAGLGLNYLRAALLLSAYSITSGFSQLIGGWLSDRVGRRIVITIGLGGVGLTVLAVGLSSTYYPMLAILVIMGIFAGAYHPSATPILAGYFDEARRGKVIGFHLLGGSLGFTIGPLLGGLIAQTLGWRYAFIILSIPALVAVPLVLKKLSQYQTVRGSESISYAPATQSPPANLTVGRFSLGQALRPVATVVILSILTQFVAGAAMAFTSLYLVDKHNVAPAYATMLMGIIRGGGMFGSLFGGWLSDKWSSRNATFLTLIAIGPIVYIFTTLPFNWVLIIILILFGVLMQMMQTAIQTYLMESTPQHLRGTVFGIYFGLSMEGRSLGQPVAGYYMDAFGIVKVFYVIALISATLSIASLLLVKKPKLRR